MRIGDRKADLGGRSPIEPLLVAREPSASCCTELAEGLGELSAGSLDVSASSRLRALAISRRRSSNGSVVRCRAGTAHAGARW